MVRAVRVPQACRAALAMTAIGAALALAAPARADCSGWDPLAVTNGGKARSMAARDLIELVGFGRPDAEPLDETAPFGLSPDGRYLATVLMRADLAANGYCQALVLLDLSGRTGPRILDTGGEFEMSHGVLRDMVLYTGFPALNPVRWSPDGRAIGYLKRLDGRTQAWVATLDGKARMASHAPDDVEAWAWSVDGHSLVYRFAAGRAAAEAAIDREGLGGWHVDARLAPHLGIRPQVPAPLPEQEVAVDPATGAETPVTATDRQRLGLDDEIPLGTRRRSAQGFAAWAERTGRSPFAPWRVRVEDARGRDLGCRGDGCVGKLAGLWWAPGGRQLVMLRREGWNNRYTALYRWAPGQVQPRHLLRTDDWIEGCVPRGPALLCLRQGAVQPPQLVSIDMATARQRIVFDPNPAFSRLQLGPVERLEWRNAMGRAVYGDLVLPPGYAGGRLPVIVTQYQSRGLLRGGTGNDYPIQLFALRGFAVLSLQRPAPAAADDPDVRTPYEVERANVRGWAERRNIDSAINTGLDLLVARGIADPNRLALTGLSDGASAVRFALVGSRRFAAAAISSCCVDETSNDVVGIGWATESAELGYPPAFPVDTDFWKPYSLALNADRIDTPLLMQLADGEALQGVHSFMALRAAGQPIDFYIYPGEYHNRWQPRHRRATFERDLDWFSFWLQGREDPAAAKAAQYAYWRTLRAARDARAPAAAAAPSRP